MGMQVGLKSALECEWSDTDAEGVGIGAASGLERPGAGAARWSVSLLQGAGILPSPPIPADPPSDPNADCVIARLRDRGADVVRFNRRIFRRAHGVHRHARADSPPPVMPAALRADSAK